MYEQQQARVFGLEILHMADADVLPYDYDLYGKEIVSYLEDAKSRAAKADKATPKTGEVSRPILNLDFTAAFGAAHRFAIAGTAIRAVQADAAADAATLNKTLREAESAFLNSAGLPKRAWYKHLIYAPGEFTGYAAVVIPGVNEAIDVPDGARAAGQLALLTAALNRSAAILESRGR